MGPPNPIFSGRYAVILKAKMRCAQLSQVLRVCEGALRVCEGLLRVYEGQGVSGDFGVLGGK